MVKPVFLFSGQGSQYSGMGKELAALCPASARVFECGSDVLGFDLAAACFEGEDAFLAQTKVSQPAIFATSLAALAAVKEQGVEPMAVAGHSLGEYAAMVASGMLSMEQGFEVIRHRAAAMQACAEGQDGAMYAIVGLAADVIQQACEETDGYVVPVNYNCPTQTAIAGESAAAAKAAELLSSKGGRAIKLNVSAAFHSALMQPAADEFYEAIKDVAFGKPSIPFYSNTLGKQMEDFSDMPGYLARHLKSPVYFVDELNALQAAGAPAYVELGPGKVLTGLVKKTFKGVCAVNIENEKTLDKALAALKELA